MIKNTKQQLKLIWTIGHNTFLETVRDKILYSILAFAALVIATSILAGSVSLGQDVRVIQSFSLTAILVFLSLISIFIGTQLVFREIERKTIYLTLTKPISREVFFLGKYIGLCLTVAISGIIMGALMLLALELRTDTFTWSSVWAIGMTIVGTWLVVALSLLFSAFTAPIPSAVYTLSLVLIGHSSEMIWRLAERSAPALETVLKTVYYIFPNLEKFNLRNEVIFNFLPETTQILHTGLYFVGYTAVLLLLGLAIFRRHEF